MTITSTLETRFGAESDVDKPDDMSLTGINPGPLPPDNIDGLDIDLSSTDILVRAEYQFPDDESVTVDTASVTVVTEVEGRGDPYHEELWADDRHTFAEFELTEVESVSED